MQGKYNKAQPLLDRAVTINEKSLGPDHQATVVARQWQAHNAASLN
jgi:hypothetical protein